MAFENLLIREKKTIGGISIDGVISETTVRTMRMTSNPIESGDNIADHVIQEPLTYTMEGVITDTPLGIGDLLGSTTGVADNVSGVFGKSDTSGQTRSQQVYYALVDFMEKKQVLEVESSLKKYIDLIMETISVTQTKDSSRSVFFTATFKQALIVKSSGSNVDPANMDSQEDKAGFGDSANSGTAPTSQANAGQSQSIGGSLAS